MGGSPSRVPNIDPHVKLGLVSSRKAYIIPKTAVDALVHITEEPCLHLPKSYKKTLVQKTGAAGKAKVAGVRNE